MSRAGPTALAWIEDLLAALRAYSVLSERSPGVFDLASRHFLHFHDTPDGIVADVFLTDGRARLPVTTHSEQADLLDRVEGCLEVVEFRGDRRRSKKSWGRGRRSE